MAVQEIVAAVIDAGQVTTDLQAMGASLASGRRIEYVSRATAADLAAQSSSRTWAALAAGPTLFQRDA